MSLAYAGSAGVQRTSCRVAAAALSVCLSIGAARADEADSQPRRDTGLARPQAAAASIHWRDVPLLDAIARLEKLFGDSIFLDRRIDPTTHVDLDIQASSSEEVLQSITAAQPAGVSRIGRLVYVGPRDWARQLNSLSRARAEEVSRLPQHKRRSLQKSGSLAWPRLTEPRALVKAVVEQQGWRLERLELITHDLWRAGELPELSLVEQLTVLLAGFDLTFKLLPEEQVIELVPVEKPLVVAADEPPVEGGEQTAPAPREIAAAKQVYSLRVVEKPVGLVLRELARRLNLRIEFEEPAIRAAGRSLDARVSIAVENVEQDELLEELLRPAGLTFEREGERIRIVPIENARK